MCTSRPSATRREHTPHALTTFCLHPTLHAYYRLFSWDQISAPTIYRSLRMFQCRPLPYLTKTRNGTYHLTLIMSHFKIKSTPIYGPPPCGPHAKVATPPTSTNAASTSLLFCRIPRNKQFHGNVTQTLADHACPSTCSFLSELDAHSVNSTPATQRQSLRRNLTDSQRQSRALLLPSKPR